MRLEMKSKIYKKEDENTHAKKEKKNGNKSMLRERGRKKM